MRSRQSDYKSAGSDRSRQISLLRAKLIYLAAESHRQLFGATVVIFILYPVAKSVWLNRVTDPSSLWFIWDFVVFEIHNVIVKKVSRLHRTSVFMQLTSARILCNPAGTCYSCYEQLKLYTTVASTQRFLEITLWEYTLFHKLFKPNRFGFYVIKYLII